jgi:nucleoside-diphosphate-sugar epimerase
VTAPVAFVAGATGSTGRAVVAALARRGATGVAHVRADSPRVEEWRARFAAIGAEVDTTPWDGAALRAALARRDPALVFALLGTTRARARREGTENPYEAVDYGLTRQLLGAVLDAAIRPKFVYLSAAGVRARVGSGYLAVRWRFEQELRASGLPFVIARPAIITGPDRDEPRPAERIAGAAADALLGLAGALGARRLRDRYRSTTNDVLAAALVRLALDPAATALVAESEALREGQR